MPRMITPQEQQKKQMKDNMSQVPNSLFVNKKWNCTLCDRHFKVGKNGDVAKWPTYKLRFELEENPNVSIETSQSTWNIGHIKGVMLDRFGMQNDGQEDYLPHENDDLWYLLKFRIMKYQNGKYQNLLIVVDDTEDTGTPVSVDSQPEQLPIPNEAYKEIGKPSTSPPKSVNLSMGTITPPKNLESAKGKFDQYVRRMQSLGIYEFFAQYPYHYVRDYKSGTTFLVTSGIEAVDFAQSWDTINPDYINPDKLPLLLADDADVKAVK